MAFGISCQETFTWLGRWVLNVEWEGNFFLTHFGNQVTDDCNYNLTKRVCQRQYILDLVTPYYSGDMGSLTEAKPL